MFFSNNQSNFSVPAPKSKRCDSGRFLRTREQEPKDWFLFPARVQPCQYRKKLGRIEAHTNRCEWHQGGDTSVMKSDNHPRKSVNHLSALIRQPPNTVHTYLYELHLYLIPAVSIHRLCSSPCSRGVQGSFLLLPMRANFYMSVTSTSGSSLFLAVSHERRLCVGHTFLWPTKLLGLP